MNLKIFILLFLPCLTFAQVPKKINFQAVLRNNDGEILSNKQVSVKIGILSGNPNGLSIYSENHVKSTDIMGLLSLKIGEGTPLTGLFSQINWGNAPHFIKLEADFNGGNNYQVIGTQELMSVPYAFYSDNGLPQAGNTLGNMLYWNGTKWENISSGQNGQMLQLVNGVPTWTGLAFGSVTTSAPNAITPGSAIVGGNVTNDGGSTITARGIVYGITPNPTLNNSKINFGVGTGSFSGPLNIGLKENTTYYYRAFATNSVGTIYGNQELFTTLLNPTLSDNSGNIYKTIQLGSQVWMGENLKTIRYRNGDAIDSTYQNTGYFNNDNWSFRLTGAWSYYGNDLSKNNLYGKLYNWYAIIDNRGICPAGWDIPDDSEWKILVDYLGGSESAGGKMKTTSNWSSPNTGATNESVFNGLPGGVRGITPINFTSIGNGGGWWSSSLDTLCDCNASYHYLRYDSNVISQDYLKKNTGLSVRCLKD